MSGLVAFSPSSPLNELFQVPKRALSPFPRRGSFSPARPLVALLSVSGPIASTILGER